MATRIPLVTTVAALVALVLGAVALAVLLARPQTTAAAAPTDVRQITVIGTAEVKAVPDTAQVQVGVQTQAPSAQEALQQNNAQMAALVSRLRELGVADTDIQTNSVSIWPRSGPDGAQVVGYDASNSVTVTVRNIAQTGDLLDRVVQAGANNIGGISFTVNDPRALRTDARNKAIEDARARATAMAQAVSGTVGNVLVITETIGSTPQPFERFTTGGGAADVAQSVPVQPGQQTITAQVQVTFELR